MITHAMLGALVGEWLLGHRMVNRALVWGALAGMLPDLVDAVAGFFVDTTTSVWWVDGPGDSLVVIAVVSWAMAKPLSRLWRADQISRRLAGWWLFGALAAHAVMDSLTPGGSSLWWPFPSGRVVCHLLPEHDPVIGLGIAVSLVRVAWMRSKKQWPLRRRALAWGTSVTMIYLICCGGMKWLAYSAFGEDLKRRGIVYQRRIEAPVAWNGLLWRGVVDCGDELWVGYRSVFEFGSPPVRWTIYPKGRNAFVGMENMREVKCLTEYTDGWWIARPHAKGAWVADVRTDEQRIWGQKKGMVDIYFRREWDILPSVVGERMRSARMAYRNDGEMARRMVRRTFGNRADWEGWPRLIGVTGSLPESLSTRE